MAGPRSKAGMKAPPLDPPELSLEPMPVELGSPVVPESVDPMPLVPESVDPMPVDPESVVPGPTPVVSSVEPPVLGLVVTAVVEEVAGLLVLPESAGVVVMPPPVVGSIGPVVVGEVVGPGPEDSEPVMVGTSAPGHPPRASSAIPRPVAIQGREEEKGASERMAGG